MSRHNRRRTRGGSKLAFCEDTRDDTEVRSLPADKAAMTPYTRPTELTAKHWHNRYVAWQVRDEQGRDERARVEAEQQRICGGEVGDDVGLCYQMMEYFSSLDYIEP